MPYIDIHTHLTHERFAADLDTVIANAVTRGLSHIVVNGLEPRSNRTILAMAQQYEVVQPALGIYPTEAVVDMLPAEFDSQPFAVSEEIDFIASQAAQGKLLAVGECGLDGHLVGEETFARQEQVFLQLCEIAMRHDLPVIVHSRKRERRVAELLVHHGVPRVNMHCFCGKVKLAQRLAEEQGYYFSIPANSRVNQGFQRMLATLPIERILTETDAPWLAPVRGERNEPQNVALTVEHLASVRNLTHDEARLQVFRNFCQLVKLPLDSFC